MHHGHFLFAFFIGLCSGVAGWGLSILAHTTPATASVVGMITGILGAIASYWIITIDSENMEDY